MKPASYCVLLTATIAPTLSADMQLVRSDPVLRRQDYEQALRSWLATPLDWLAGLVFVENSGADLRSLRQIAEKENTAGIPVEFISCRFPPPPPGLHYGYSEACLVLHALETSELLRKSEYFIKATGRYLFPDVNRLVRSLPEHYDIAVDCKLSKFWARDRHYLANFALALFRRRFFEEQLQCLPSRMVPAPPWTRAQFIEAVLYDRLLELKAEHRIIWRWPVGCEPLGIGANGDHYGSAKKRLQRRVRSVGRCVLPWLWM